MFSLFFCFFGSCLVLVKSLSSTRSFSSACCLPIVSHGDTFWKMLYVIWSVLRTSLWLCVFSRPPLITVLLPYLGPTFSSSHFRWDLFLLGRNPGCSLSPTTTERLPPTLDISVKLLPYSPHWVQLWHSFYWSSVFTSLFFINLCSWLFFISFLFFSYWLRVLLFALLVAVYGFQKEVWEESKRLPSSLGSSETQTLCSFSLLSPAAGSKW